LSRIFFDRRCQNNQKESPAYISFPSPESEKYAKIPSLGVMYTQQALQNFFKKIIPENPLDNIHTRLSPRIFEKNQNDPKGILRGQEDTDLRKKPEVKNLVSDSL
jgi:hypothetical protein